MKVGAQLTVAGVLGAFAGAIAGAVAAGVAGGALGFGMGALSGFGHGAAVGLSVGSSAGAIAVAVIGVIVAFARAGGDPEEALPEAIGFGLLGAAIGSVVIGVLAALIMGAQYALHDGVATSKAWALAWMPYGAAVGTLVGVWGGVKLELRFGFFSA